MNNIITCASISLITLVMIYYYIQYLGMKHTEEAVARMNETADFIAYKIRYNDVVHMEFEDFKYYMKETCGKVHVVKGGGSYYNNLEDTYITSCCICIKGTLIIPSRFIDYMQITSSMSDYLVVHKIKNSTNKKNYKNTLVTQCDLYEEINKSEHYKDVINDIIVFLKMPQCMSSKYFIKYDETSNNIYAYLNDEDITPFALMFMLSLVKTSKNKLNAKLGEDEVKTVLEDIYMDIHKFAQEVMKNNPDITFWTCGEEATDEYLGVLMTMVYYTMDERIIKYMSNYKNINYAFLFYGDQLSDMVMLDRSNAVGHTEEELNQLGVTEE